MFSKGSRGKGVAGEVSAALLLAALVLAGALSLAGCGGDDEKGSLIGAWVSTGGDTYTITGTTVTYTASYDASMSCVGTIKNAPDFEQPYGVIIIEYTTPPTYYDYGPAPDYAQSNPHHPAGNFQGIYWKDLTTTSVKLASAYPVYPATGEPEKATLSDAEAAFTLESESSYVSLYGAYTK